MFEKVYRVTAIAIPDTQIAHDCFTLLEQWLDAVMPGDRRGGTATGRPALALRVMQVRAKTASDQIARGRRLVNEYAGECPRAKGGRRARKLACDGHFLNCWR